jgi:hypothetical protein
MDPDFAQNAALIAVAIVTALIGVFKYIKTEASKVADKPADVGSVLAASFIDNRTLRELIDALRLHMEEYTRENRKINRARSELTSALEEATDAVLANADATINMMRFLKKRDYQGEIERGDSEKAV